MSGRYFLPIHNGAAIAALDANSGQPRVRIAGIDAPVRDPDGPAKGGKTRTVYMPVELV
jgi:hypothetical protein